MFASIPIEDASESVAAGDEVHRALAAIPEAQREALVLIEWLGLDSEEAGRVLGIDDCRSGDAFTVTGLAPETTERR